MDEARARRRGGRRKGGEGSRNPGTPRQPVFQQPTRRFPPTDLVEEEQLEAIHQTSLQILSEIGIDFLHEEARERLNQAGANVDGHSERVRFDPEFILETIKTAPSEFTLHARNQDHNIHIGGDKVAFTAVSSPPNVGDEAGGRRVGNRADYQNLLRMGQTLNMVHLFGGYPVEPVDIHPSVRHLDAMYDMLTLTNKVVHAYSLGKQRNHDVLEMVKIARQIDDATLETEPSVASVVNASSPLRYDTPMLQGIIEFSSRNQVIVITPFTLAGAMAPVTVAGAMAQHNAEALAGIAFTQVVRPGAPVIYGGFTSNVDMQSGAPAFGTPEFMQTQMITGQLTRRYGIPYRSSGVNAANALDAQAAYESVFSLWGAIMGGAHMVLHAIGWMEGGLRASFEKMVLDADLCAMVSRFMDPIDFSESGLALEAVRDVGPGGHYFGTPHTLERYRDAFYQPLISNWSNYESWEEAGKPEARQRMIELVDQFMKAYEEPPMDASVRAELADFVERRKAEGGVETDY